MSSKKVWLATVATLAGVAFIGSALVESASAQYRGYGYRNDEAPDYYYGTPYSPPGYDPYGDPDGGPAPRARRGDYGGYGDRGYGGPPEDYDRGARRMPYADPLNGPQGRRDLPRGGDYSYDYDNPNAGGPGYDQGPYGGTDPNHKASDADLGDTASRTTRTEVENRTHQPPGTIVINTAERHLYYTQPNGMALMYGIGVGRQGFTWKGAARVERKAEWPDWIPPSDMLKRRPDLPTRMSGGIENPLGARAMYLFQGNKDTMFRIHGTNEPDTIGKAVSSGCIRMMNADVIDLYRRVPVGTKVVVI